MGKINATFKKKTVPDTRAPSVRKKLHVSLYDSCSHYRYYYRDDCSNDISYTMLV